MTGYPGKQFQTGKAQIPRLLLPPLSRPDRYRLSLEWDPGIIIFINVPGDYEVQPSVPRPSLFSGYPQETEDVPGVGTRPGFQC